MNNLIFGYTWEQLKKAKQDVVLLQIAPLQARMAKDDICTKQDLELLEKWGIDGLRKNQFSDVLARLQLAGVYDPNK